jgi:hypothetical protein
MPDPNETTVENTEHEAVEMTATETDDYDKERAMTTIRQLRAFEKDARRLAKEKKELEVKLLSYQQAEEAKKQAEMSELEKYKAEAEKSKLEREAILRSSQETLLKAAFLAEAALAGLQHPEDAYLLADKSGVEMTDGKASGVKEAIQALVKAERVPLAKRTAPGLDAGAGSGENPKDKPKPLTDEELRAAKRMGVKPEEYQKYKTK